MEVEEEQSDLVSALSVADVAQCKEKPQLGLKVVLTIIMHTHSLGLYSTGSLTLPPIILTITAAANIIIITLQSLLSRFYKHYIKIIDKKPEKAEKDPTYYHI